MIDTLAFSERLRAAGADERLAKASAEAVAQALKESSGDWRRDLATKDDIAALKAELAGIKVDVGEIRHEVATLRAEMRGLDQRLSNEIGSLEQRLVNKIIEAQYNLIKWLVPIFLGQAALITALVKLL